MHFCRLSQLADNKIKLMTHGMRLIVNRNQIINTPTVKSLTETFFTK